MLADLKSSLRCAKISRRDALSGCQIPFLDRDDLPVVFGFVLRRDASRDFSGRRVDPAIQFDVEPVEIVIRIPYGERRFLELTEEIRSGRDRHFTPPPAERLPSQSTIQDGTFSTQPRPSAT